MSDNEDSNLPAAIKAVLENPDSVERLSGGFFGPVGELWQFAKDAVREHRFTKVAEWRLRNRQRILKLADDLRREANLQQSASEPLPSRVGAQYLEYLDEEDEPTLQELWARLLVNTTRSDTSKVLAQRAFGDLLRAMDPDDGLLFNVFASRPEISQFWIFGYTPASNAASLLYDLAPLKKKLDSTADPVAVFEERDRQIDLPGWPMGRLGQTIDRLRRLSLIEYAFGQEDEFKRIVETPYTDEVTFTNASGRRQLEGPMAAIDARSRTVIKYRVTPLGTAFYAALAHPGGETRNRSSSQK